MQRHSVFLFLSGLIIASILIPFNTKPGNESLSSAQAIISRPNMVVMMVDDLDERTLKIMIDQ
jgi:hypothetical protein